MALPSRCATSVDQRAAPGRGRGRRGRLRRTLPGTADDEAGHQADRQRDRERSGVQVRERLHEHEQRAGDGGQAAGQQQTPRSCSGPPGCPSRSRPARCPGRARSAAPDPAAAEVVHQQEQRDGDGQRDVVAPLVGRQPVERRAERGHRHALRSAGDRGEVLDERREHGGQGQADEREIDALSRAVRAARRCPAGESRPTAAASAVVTRCGQPALATRIAVVYAPTPKKAPWPSEIWPDQPVSTTSPSTAMASAIWRPTAPPRYGEVTRGSTTRTASPSGEQYPPHGSRPSPQGAEHAHTRATRGAAEEAGRADQQHAEQDHRSASGSLRSVAR